MADVLANIAKGRAVQWYLNVDGNTPANSALVFVALKAAGIETDDTLRGYDDLAAVLAASNDEATNTNYARKVLTDADLAAATPDDTNDWFSITIPNLLWSPGPATAGGAWAKIVACYDDDTTSGTDSNIIPICFYDAAYTPDGTDLLVQPHANGLVRAV